MSANLYKVQRRFHLLNIEINGGAGKILNNLTALLEICNLATALLESFDLFPSYF